MEPQEFVRYRPRLYHAALAANLPLIRKHGLLSTSALLDLADQSHRGRRRSLESSRRNDVSELLLEDGSTARLRDNKTISDKQLRRLLPTGTPTSAWYEELNRRVFFWVTEGDAAEFLHHYRDHSQVLMIFDSGRMLELFAPRVAVTTFNTGVTFNNVPRGPKSFVRLEDAARASDIRELTIERSVPLADVVVEVWSVHDGARSNQLAI